MKKILFVLCLLSAAAAFAQNSIGGYTLNSQPSIPSSPSHPAHAGYTPMAQEQSVLVGTSYTMAQGDRPASDFPHPEGASLGNVARELRKEHAQLRKSRVVWVNQ
ncbi:MAG: hypothetical protein ABSB87_14915 [Terriglobales bacterium]|jgi:hypothetical protein